MKRFTLALAVIVPLSGFLHADPIVQCAPDAAAFDERAYWTAARIRAARAFPIPILSDTDTSALIHRPLLSANSTGFMGARSTIASVPASGTPHTASVSAPPHNFVGKLLFKANGVDSYCTAQIVQEDSMILTAAHCVRDELSGAFNENFAFIAGFDDGLNRLAKVTHIGTWSTFPNARPNYNIDYAFGHLKTTLGGHLELEARLPSKRWISVGYPKDIQGGFVQQKVDGEGNAVGGNLVEMTENEMNGGASGGAFVAKIKGKHTAIGVNSYRSGLNMYSPFFDAAIWDVYRHVKAGCPN